MFTERDPFYQQSSAYQSLNLLMKPGRDGERVWVCIEKQNPDSICITRWDKTLEVPCDLFTVLCKYASDRAAQGKPLPGPLERGDRGVNFELMRQGGGTIAFTSTSTSKAEVLLPPMLAMTCGECEVRIRPELGPVRHYHLTLEGFRPDGEIQDEQVLTDTLNAHAEAAAEGLRDLVKRRLDADILRDEGHPYWTWKAAFRRLVLQRMQAIYGLYFAE